jgi:hypothetical protein
MTTIAAPPPQERIETSVLLGSYLTEKGTMREIRLLVTPEGRRLVIDDSAAGGEARLVGALFPDEPEENAQLLSNMYLADGGHRRPCQPLTAGDLDPVNDADERPGELPSELSGVDGRRFLISVVQEPEARRVVRWVCLLPGADPTSAEPITLRDVIAQTQSYEPARSMTVAAYASARKDACLATHEIRRELGRLLASQIVLNRGLRETVLERLALGDLSMSEIAMRCGRRKRTARSESGDTAWLRRRIGLLPEGGQPHPTPWVHSDVLALIARDGLGISPHEVEL